MLALVRPDGHGTHTQLCNNKQMITMQSSEPKVYTIKLNAIELSFYLGVTTGRQYLLASIV